MVVKVASGTYHFSVMASVLRAFSSSTFLFTYNGAALSSSSPANAPTSGSLIVGVFGKSYAHADYSRSMLSLSTTASESVIWHSDSSIASKVPNGVRNRLTIKVSMNVFANSISSIFSYDAPTSLNLQPNQMPISGAFYARVFSLGLGYGDYSQKSDIGGSSCAPTNWRSDSSLMCKIIAGSGIHPRSVVVSSGGLVSKLLSTSVSFNVQLLKSYSLPGLVSSGSSSVTVRGDLFGLHGVTPKLKMHLSSVETTFWVSDSSTVLKAVSLSSSYVLVGMSIHHRVATSLFNLAIQPGTVSGVLMANGATSASEMVSVLGALFGNSASPTLVLGFSACESTIWLSSSHMLCRTASGVAGRLSLAASVSSLPLNSMSQAWTFNTLALEHAYDTHRNTSKFSADSGSIKLFVTGFGFSAFDASVTSRFGRSSSESTAWTSTSLIGVKSCGSTRIYAVAATVGIQRSSSGFNVSTPQPSVSSARVTNVPTTGCALLTLFGSNFGSAFSSVAFRFGQSSMEFSFWLSTSSVHAKSFAGHITTSLFASVDGLSGQHLSDVLSYNSPVICNGGSFHGPSTGGSVVFVHASNVGAFGASATIRFGLTSAESSRWFSESSVVAKVTRGRGVQAQVVASAGSRTGSVTQAFTYVGVFVSSFSSLSLPATGSVFATVFGKHMSSEESSPKSSVGGTTAMMTEWKASSALRLKTAQGFASNNIVSVSVDTRSALLTKFCRTRYQPCRIQLLQCFHLLLVQNLSY